MVRRQRSQWGNLEYDPVRKVARIRYWCTTDKGYRRVSKSFRNVASRMDAEKIRARLMLEHSDDAPCPTVGQAWEQWLLPELEQRVEEGDLAKNTMRVYSSAWNAHVSGRWGEVACDAVKALDVQQWLLDGKTRVQASNAKAVLSMILDKAVRYEVVPANVARAKFLLPGKSTVAERDKGTWSLPELGEVWEAVRDTPLEAPFILSAFGSCRVGESLGPKADEVSVVETEHGEVTVVGIVRQIDLDGKVSDRLKTEASRRSVIIPGNAGARLAEIAKESDEWLCSDGCGSPLSQRVVNAEFQRLVTGSLYHPFRNLRNSWQTYCRWDLGLPPWCSETLMGHAGKDVTGRYYDRPSAEQLAKVVAKAWSEWRATHQDPVP